MHKSKLKLVILLLEWENNEQFDIMINNHTNNYLYAIFCRIIIKYEIVHDIDK